MEHLALNAPPDTSLDGIFSGEIVVDFEEAIRVLCISSWRDGGFWPKVFENY